MEAQKIIITGGATRIGAAIAERLSGFKVQILIQYNKSKSKAENLRNNLEEKGSKIYLIKADLGKEKDVLKIVKFEKKNMGFGGGVGGWSAKKGGLARQEGGPHHLFLFLLNVGLTRTRVPTATPEDDRGEKAEPRRYAPVSYTHLRAHET